MAILKLPRKRFQIVFYVSLIALFISLFILLDFLTHYRKMKDVWRVLASSDDFASYEDLFDDDVMEDIDDSELQRLGLSSQEIRAMRSELRTH
ncbi:unnamed protein product [Auanema sp. JU1783]|nr:unnamed protein product [Auanema sp. JU1783]